MAMVSKLTALDWPAGKHNVTVQCVGQAFVELEARRQGIEDESISAEPEEEILQNSTDPSNSKDSIDLLKVSSKKLQKLTFYDVLGDLPLHATAEEVKKAYHKACLVYHPDKTGRGEDDEVFLKVKAAFDTLSEKSKRKAYDSQMPFDDSIPKGNEIACEFYEVYGPVFERNLRFDDRLNPDRKQPTGRKNKRKKGPKGPPQLGDDETPLEKVHAFYDYWTHFESWRDFSLEAAKLTNNENFDADNVDSRYEKRYVQKEIDRKARALKREEMARINLLVERAMAADPRLKREKLRVQEEKERIERERREEKERLEKETREREEREAAEKAIREAREKEKKANEKKEKEKNKKVLRKAKALFRKLCIAANESGKTYWTTIDEMYNDVEYLCDQLSAEELGELSNSFGGAEGLENPNLGGVDVVQSKVLTLREGKSQEEILTAVKKAQAKRSANGKANGHAYNDSSSWTEQQTKQLEQGLAKFPASMDKNERWDNISKRVEGKSKKECVEQFKRIREALRKKK